MVGQATFQKELFEGLNGAFELLSGKVMTQIQTLQMTPAQGATAEIHGNPKMLTPPRSKHQGRQLRSSLTPWSNGHPAVGPEPRGVEWPTGGLQLICKLLLRATEEPALFCLHNQVK